MPLKHGMCPANRLPALSMHADDVHPVRDEASMSCRFHASICRSMTARIVLDRRLPTDWLDTGTGDGNEREAMDGFPSVSYRGFGASEPIRNIATIIRPYAHFAF